MPALAERLAPIVLPDAAGGEVHLGSLWEQSALPGHESHRLSTRDRHIRLHVERIRFPEGVLCGSWTAFLGDTYDCMHRAANVQLGSGPRTDADAHADAAMPYGAAAPAGAFFLHRVHHGPRDFIG